MKLLTKKDFLEALMATKIKDSQTGKNLRQLVYDEGMAIAVEAVFELYQSSLTSNENQK